MNRVLFNVGLVAIILVAMMASFGSPNVARADNPVKVADKDSSIQILPISTTGPEYIWLQVYWNQPVDRKFVTKIRAKSDRARELGYVLSVDSHPGWIPGTTTAGTEWQEYNFRANGLEDIFKTTPYDIVVWSNDLRFRIDLNWQGGHFGECASSAYTGFAVYKIANDYLVTPVVRQMTGQTLQVTTDFGESWESVPSGTMWPTQRKLIPTRGRVDFFLEKTQNYARYCGGMSWGPTN